MPNHVHLIAVPTSENALRQAIGVTRAASIYANGGAGTFGRGGLPLS
jgi:hypothetical protein